MRRLSILAVVAFLAAILLSGAAQAMDIIRFMQMTSKDRQSFIDFLPQAAETVLHQEGRSDDAAKVHQLFNHFSPGSDMTLGVGELEMNLANQDVRNVQQHIKNHAAPQLQVESALALTLSKNGIQVTPDFVKALMQQTSTFQRSLVSFGHPVAQRPAPLPPPLSPAPPAASHPAPADDDPIGPGGFITPPKR